VTGRSSTQENRVLKEKKRNAMPGLDNPSFEDFRLDGVNHALDELAHLRKRWDHRLTVDNLALAKRYIDMELRIVFAWQDGAHEYRAILQREFPIPGGSHRNKKVWSSHPDFWGRVTDIRTKDHGALSGPYRYDRLVFIEDVELVELPKGFVPTLVWFQILDNTPRLGAGPLYVFGKRGFKFLFGLPNNEMDMFVTLPRWVTMPDDRDHEQIESGARIMDDIANYSAPLFGDAFIDSNLPMALSFAKVILNRDSVGITGTERLDFFGQLPDVAFGPFDL
jgi:hypothetical protein